MMLQVDGSPHDWLEGRGPPMCLIGGIDDATSKVTGGFFTQAESSWGYFTLFSDTFREHGLPHCLYTDCHSVFWTDREPTLAEQLINKKPTTEVGRGLEELGVTLILAHSPQAKGGLKDCGTLFKTGWLVNSGWPTPKPWKRLKQSWSVTSLSTIAGSPSRLGPSLPGERSAR